jgi:hypothetical protein
VLLDRGHEDAATRRRGDRVLVVGDGVALFEVARQHGGEGIVSKRVGSRCCGGTSGDKVINASLYAFMERVRACVICRRFAAPIGGSVASPVV